MPFQRLLTGIWGWSHAPEDVVVPVQERASVSVSVATPTVATSGEPSTQPRPRSLSGSSEQHHSHPQLHTPHRRSYERSGATSAAAASGGLMSLSSHSGQSHQHHHRHHHRASSSSSSSASSFNVAALPFPPKHAHKQQRLGGAGTGAAQLRDRQQQQQQLQHPRQQQANPSSASPGRCHSAVLLPPQVGPARKTLVLDLDKTLIDCVGLREKSTADYDFVYTDDQGTQAKVWTRPFLRQFLSATSQAYELVLFTAAGQRHADSVLQRIDPKGTLFSHRLYGHHTSETPLWSWVKDLSRLGRPLESTLLVDDSVLAALLQPCNLVPIRPFAHDHPQRDVDTALSDLLRFLMDKVAPAADVRTAIALHWDKVLRHPRKRALQPRQPPSTANTTTTASSAPSCDCSCHLTHRASLPPPRAPDVSPSSLTQLPSSHPEPPTELAGWRRCPAVNDGCGCVYNGATDMAALAAAYQVHHQALAWAMQAADGDSDCDDDNGVTAAAPVAMPHEPSCCGCRSGAVLTAVDGCVGGVGGDADSGCSSGGDGSGGGHPAGARRGMRRSPKRYLELDSAHNKQQLLQLQQGQQPQQVLGNAGGPCPAAPVFVAPGGCGSEATAMELPVAVGAAVHQHACLAPPTPTASTSTGPAIKVAAPTASGLGLALAKGTVAQAELQHGGWEATKLKPCSEAGATFSHGSLPIEGVWLHAPYHHRHQEQRQPLLPDGNSPPLMGHSAASTVAVAAAPARALSSEEPLLTVPPEAPWTIDTSVIMTASGNPSAAAATITTSLASMSGDHSERLPSSPGRTSSDSSTSVDEVAAAEILSTRGSAAVMARLLDGPRTALTDVPDAGRHLPWHHACTEGGLSVPAPVDGGVGAAVARAPWTATAANGCEEQRVPLPQSAQLEGRVRAGRAKSLGLPALA